MFSIINWHETKKELPKKSGNYLVVTTNTNSMTTLNYSEKYKKFNACDDLGEEFALSVAIKVRCWANIPKTPKREVEDGNVL